MPDRSSRRFTPDEIEVIYSVITERRDMQHFLRDPVDPVVLARLFQAAHDAPSVGFMQPWRFIRITDCDLREKIRDLVEADRTP